MPAYKHRPGILVQRDMAMIEFASVAAALEDPNFESPGPEDTVMLVSNRGQMFDLNLTGALIWEAIDGQKTEDALVDVLAGNFEIDAAVARRDLRSLVEELQRRGLIEIAA